QPITIDSDTARRMGLNAERNPRATYDPLRPTNSGEATQTLNPITGRAYEDVFMPECERNRIKNNPGLKEWNANLYVDKLLHFISQTSPAIELQKALGRMEVREGNLPEFFYEEFLEDIDKLTEIYAQNPFLTLESITDVNGLNAALRSKGLLKDLNDYKSFYEKNIDIEVEEENFKGIRRGMASQVLSEINRKRIN
ncbi:MAG: hypothetical protein AABW93_02985, partial [Nanoarchaeota archaeon]